MTVIIMSLTLIMHDRQYLFVYKEHIVFFNIQDVERNLLKIPEFLKIRK